MTNDNLETTSRLVAWRINSLPKNSEVKSKEFFIGKWSWLLECYQYNEKIHLVLTSIGDQSIPCPIASFIVHIFCSKDLPSLPPKLEKLVILASLASQKMNGRGADPLSLLSLVVISDFAKEWTDNEIPYGERYAHAQKDMSTLHATMSVTFSLEFLDLKMEVGNDKKRCSIWKDEYFSEQNAAVEPMSKMFLESIYTDIVINTMEGNFEAHRAVLAASSPVFKSMFSENYIENETSTIKINDMSTEACRAMLNFVYGKRDCNELQAYGMELIIAADKYDIVNLKRACETSLCESVGANYVFEMLTCAHRYDLIDLKRTCLFYLMKMGMIFKLQEGYNSFLREADRELIVEVSDACLKAWETN